MKIAKISVVHFEQHLEIKTITDDIVKAMKVKGISIKKMAERTGHTIGCIKMAVTGYSWSSDKIYLSRRTNRLDTLIDMARVLDLRIIALSDNLSYDLTDIGYDILPAVVWHDFKESSKSLSKLASSTGLPLSTFYQRHRLSPMKALTVHQVTIGPIVLVCEGI